MGLIATARFRRAAERALAVAEYTQHLESTLAHLVAIGEAHKSRFWNMAAAEGACRGMLVLSSNRGLCGGYNTLVVRLALNHWQQLKAEAGNLPVRVEVSGKRGASSLRFAQVPLAEVYTHLSESPKRTDVSMLAERYWQLYCRGELTRLDVVYMRMLSLSRQIPVVETLLPPAAPGMPKNDQLWPLPLAVDFDFYPSAGEVTDRLLEAVFSARLMRAVFDAAAAEQIARMTAMRAATENAEMMLSRLSLLYHRARQTQITSELLELMAAADALQRGGNS
jgi:F-type H+-transporting ATPase subunit gamma